MIESDVIMVKIHRLERAAACNIGDIDDGILIDALRELLSRREAEAGEVAVEGYAESKVFDGVPWEVRGRGKAHAELRFYDLPMPGTVSAVVTLRRRAEAKEGEDQR